ncbi:OBAP family protein [Geminicoccaceae bacterium SYSU G07066]|uniref:OBAP family protein n=1 Tax=Benzoatithermus flavus TaxID=3108223 RepID=A0ABU8XUQ6_9PROT
MTSRLASALCLLLLAACAGSGAGPSTTPAGRPKTTGTTMLETGAAVLQPDAAPRSLDIYLVGFHPMKDRPDHQIEAHHFCHQVNEDLAQCALFDGSTAGANLTGIEYIVSERLFRRLPAAERRYWHPHNGEILSGQLVAPGLPEPAEKALMRTKINSYGKTWHTWDTMQDRGGEHLPLGPPELAWSFDRDGEVRPGLVEARDRRLGIDTAAKRASRQDLLPLARPQAGVDALKGRFGRPTRPIPGVVDSGEAQP